MGTERRPLDIQAYRGESGRKPLPYHFTKNGSSGEVPLQRVFQGNELLKAGLQRRALSREIGSVQRIPHFQTKGITCPQAARFDSGGQQSIPETTPFGNGHKDLEPILAGITRPSDERRRATLFGKRGDSVALGNLKRGVKGPQDPLRVGSLERDGRVVVAQINESDRTIRGKSSPHPSEIDVTACCVDHEKILQLSRTVEDQVIDHTSALREHEGVLAIAMLKFADPVGQKALQPWERSGTGNKNLAHVGYVEHSRGGAHSAVFVQDAGVLNRHEPTTETDHAGVGIEMGLLKRGVSESVGFAHKTMFRQKSPRRDGDR